MLILGAVILALIVLAFAGHDLGVDRENASGWECALFVLLLIGIVSKRHASKDDEEF